MRHPCNSRSRVSIPNRDAKNKPTQRRAKEAPPNDCSTLTGGLGGSRRVARQRPCAPLALIVLHQLRARSAQGSGGSARGARGQGADGSAPVMLARSWLARCWLRGEAARRARRYDAIPRLAGRAAAYKKRAASWLLSFTRGRGLCRLQVGFVPAAAVLPNLGNRRRGTIDDS